MKNLINKTLNASRKYTIFDYSLLKICLISLGILLGVSFSQFFSKYLSIIGIIFIISYILILYKTFIKY
ncbi:permease of phosphate ABC transporter [Tepidibacter aestuarii]|uniref:permease of phosphate ABC transporter n=1 Tax=Tepidibacter aestuarii TaxID=2925782 RepID=UPI0020BF6589|nr:permease of phosphate ABC transporter [Tepidibacter aestuarii]